MVPFDTSNTTYYWSAIVTIAHLVPLSSYLTLNNIVILKYALRSLKVI